MLGKAGTYVPATGHLPSYTYAAIPLDKGPM